MWRFYIKIHATQLEVKLNGDRGGRKMIIGVIDGQGGGIGRAIVERIKSTDELKHLTVYGLGTNSAATGQMLRGGADEAATGENAIVHNAGHVDIIIGPVGIINANAMMGELTPKMAEAIGSSHALKILLPLNKCHIQVVSVMELTISQHVDNAVKVLIEVVINR